MKIVSLEDDSAQSEMIRTTLEVDGHDVLCFREGGDVIRYLENAVADLLVLDWWVPDISGVDVLRWVRQRIGEELPVLFLTNCACKDETVAALNAGADDYVVKPVHQGELRARVHALLRRAYPPTRLQDACFDIGKYVIDMRDRRISLNGLHIDLTSKEFELAALLFRNAGRVMPRDVILKIIWGRNLEKLSRSLDTHIYRLRNKLRLGPETGVRLRSIYAHGYRIEVINEESL